MLWFSFFLAIIVLSCTLNGAEMQCRGILQNAECRMALFSICKWGKKTIKLCFLTLWEQSHSAFCVLQNIPAWGAILCWFALWRLSFFSTYPPGPPHYPPPPPHVCPHLLRPTQTHRNRNSKICFQDMSKVQMKKIWSETHFWHAKQIIAWENRNFTTPPGKPLVASKSVICFVRLSK